MLASAGWQGFWKQVPGWNWLDQLYFIDAPQQALFPDRVVGRTECYGKGQGVPCIWEGLACTQRSMSIWLAPLMEEGKAAVGMGRETNGEA